MHGKIAVPQSTRKHFHRDCRGGGSEINVVHTMQYWFKVVVFLLLIREHLKKSYENNLYLPKKSVAQFNAVVELWSAHTFKHNKNRNFFSVNLQLKMRTICIWLPESEKTTDLIEPPLFLRPKMFGLSIFLTTNLFLPVPQAHNYYNRQSTQVSIIVSHFVIFSKNGEQLNGIENKKLFLETHEMLINLLRL